KTMRPEQLRHKKSSLPDNVNPFPLRIFDFARPEQIRTYVEYNSLPGRLAADRQSYSSALRILHSLLLPVRLLSSPTCPRAENLSLSKVSMAAARAPKPRNWRAHCARTAFPSPSRASPGALLRAKRFATCCSTPPPPDFPRLRKWRSCLLPARSTF